MKKLLFLSTAIVFTTYQAYALDIKEYVAIRGGYYDSKHQTKEQYTGVEAPPKQSWNEGLAGVSVAYGLKAGYLRAEIEGNANDSTEITRNFYSDDGTFESTVIGKIQTSSILFNSYLELPIDFPVKPYIGAGIGLAHIRAKFQNKYQLNNAKSEVSKNHFAWQVGAGLTWEITRNWAMDMGYRFLDYGTIQREKHTLREDGTSEDSKLRIKSKAHNVYVGARYSF